MLQLAGVPNFYILTILIYNLSFNCVESTFILYNLLNVHMLQF